MSRKTLLRLTALIAIVVFVLGAARSYTAVEAGNANGKPITSQYIIVLKDGANPHMMAQASGGEVLYIYEHAIKGFAVRMPEQAANALRNNPNVASVVQDEVVQLSSNELPSSVARISAQAGQTIPTGIRRINGNTNSTLAGNGSGSVNVDVAVIDTGIDTSHPDLNVVGGKNCVKGPNSYNDGNGHGTHVAGTIAAKDDGAGVVGVAPGARLYAVRVLNNQGSGTTSSVVCGIDWVASQSAIIEVANMSLGGSGTDSTCGGADTYHNAICTAVSRGITFVVAAGNSNVDAKDSRPATYDEVITVSALADFNGAAGGGAASTCRADVDDTRADFSNFGADVDIMAPGVCIYSTWMGAGYNTISGTSMASPHAAGAAALYKANNPSATPSQVKNALQSSGNLNWDASDDGDSIKEKLLDVGTY
ncbi:MAG: S8 family serine peptidase [Ardenticatenales bacterium]|nr:S8 family serine peptidase [Ardenticatenales bacterium]